MLLCKVGGSGRVVDAPLAEAPLTEGPAIGSAAPVVFMTPASVSAGEGCKGCLNIEVIRR